MLLLVSVDFINSAYGYDVEFQQALSMQEAEQATVIPVILRACMWKETPLHKFQALPKDGKAVSSWDDRDEALTNVAQGIKDVAVQLTTKR